MGRTSRQRPHTNHSSYPMETCGQAGPLGLRSRPLCQQGSV